MPWPHCPECRQNIREFDLLPYSLEDGTDVLALYCVACGCFLAVLTRQPEPEAVRSPQTRQSTSMVDVATPENDRSRYTYRPPGPGARISRP